MYLVDTNHIDANSNNYSQEGFYEAFVTETSFGNRV